MEPRLLAPDLADTQTRGGENTLRRLALFVYPDILVPRAYDPSGLRQESRALGATILK